MINNLKLFNRSGIVIPVDITYPMDVYKNVKDSEYSQFFDASSKGISWKHNSENIILIDEKVDLFGYPSIDQNFMVVIYEGQNDFFPPPNNAIVYNLDGSVHKVLKMPKLVSPRILENIKKERHSNPPIEDNRYGHYGMGLKFRGFAWDKDIDGNLINTISIEYMGEYGEWRVFNPETGEFGAMINDWYQGRSWR